MKKLDQVIATVLANLPLPEDNFVADGKFWLTVYLEGDQNSFILARPRLLSLEWLNLDLEAEFSGFVYTKKKVQNTPDQIAEALIGILQITEETGLHLSIIDADTAFEPSVSTFKNLFKQQ